MQTILGSSCQFFFFFSSFLLFASSQRLLTRCCLILKDFFFVLIVSPKVQHTSLKVSYLIPSKVPYLVYLKVVSHCVRALSSAVCESFWIQAMKKYLSGWDLCTIKKCVWLHVKKQTPLIFQCTSLTTQTFKWFMCDSIFVSRLFFYWCVYRKKNVPKSVFFFFSGLTLFIFCLNSCNKKMLNLTKSLFYCCKK